MNDSEYIKKLEEQVQDLTTRLKNLDSWAHEIEKSYRGGYHLPAIKLVLNDRGKDDTFEFFVLKRDMIPEIQKDNEILSEEYVFINLPYENS